MDWFSKRDTNIGLLGVSFEDILNLRIYNILIIIIIIIIHNLYSAALLKDPAALYNNGNVNIKSVR